MLIAQLANFYGAASGGQRTAIDELGRGYLARGHERLLVVPGEHDGDEQTPAGRRVTLASPALPAAGGYRVIRKRGAVETLLAEVQPDRLEVSDKLTLPWLGRWGRRHGVPTVLLSHERIDAILAPRVPGALPLAAFADRWNRRLVRMFDHIVCTSSFGAAEFQRIGAPNLSVVPLGVDLATFRPLRPMRPAGPLASIVCVGRLSREKRPEVAVAALEVLRRRGMDVRLTMVGSGPMQAELERRAAALPVTFVGHVADRAGVAALQAAADVALQPCPHESFGLAVLEALACGTPVVVPDRGAAAELVIDRAGLATVPDPEALASGIAEVLRTPCAARRHAARRRAEQFPWDRTVDRMLTVHGPVRLAA